jgi:hypothetical protein
LSLIVVGKAPCSARPVSVESRDPESGHGARSPGAYLRLKRPS